MASSLLRLTSVAVIAHRGGSALGPENTLAAFDHAQSLGVDGFELDVHLSSDGVPVVIHDSTLERTTNGTGAVGTRSAAELSAFSVPTLAEVLDRYPSMPIVVEIKGDDPNTAARAVDVIRAAAAERRVIVAGFSQVAVDAARRLAPDIPTSASRPEARAAIRRSRFWLPLGRAPYRAFLVPFRQRGRQRFSRSFVRAARRAETPVLAWTINEAEDMRTLIDWGVSGLVTDRPDLAIKEVGPRT
jgi:glycerophosphoryl diester phosphodiesterase